MGNTVSDETGADFSFIYFPTNLRPRREDSSIPSWNIWDDTLPGYFFNSMKGMLADDGFVAVLSSSEDFEDC